MKQIINKVKQFFKEIWLGIKITEQNRDKSQLGKF